MELKDRPDYIPEVIYKQERFGSLQVAFYKQKSAEDIFDFNAPLPILYFDGDYPVMKSSFYHAYYDLTNIKQTEQGYKYKLNRLISPEELDEARLNLVQEDT